MAYQMRIWDIPPPPGAEEYTPTPMPPAPVIPPPVAPPFMNPGYFTGNMNYNCPPPGVYYPPAVPSHDRFSPDSRYSRRSRSPKRYSRNRSGSPRRYDRYKRRSSSRRRRSRSRSRRRSRSRNRRNRKSRRSPSRSRRRRSSSNSSRSSHYSRSSSSSSKEEETIVEETQLSATSSQSSAPHRGLDRKSHKEFIKTKAQEYTNRNQNSDKDAANSFKNDGSFLEMFKKLQEEKETKVKEEKVEDVDRPEKILNIVAAASTLLEPSKPPILPVVAKRRGGRILKTGMVEKKRFVVPEEQPKDAWAVYMKEVKRYKEACCDDDSKTRPLVK